MKTGFRLRNLTKLVVILTFTGTATLQGQVGPDRNGLVPPVDIPIFLAGNFGEPRANHFHAGIDIKTNGVTGIPVKAVADGYVSRIKVEPGGYGKALYIKHPNGYTTLCGHLHSFSPEIARYVKSEQYRRESFAVDLFPDSSVLGVKMGQVIAMSGNSGSSEGPHLHFEFRETQSENPVNPLVRSITARDGIAPVIKSIRIYSLKDTRGWTRPVSVPVILNGGIYRPAEDKAVPLDVRSGIAIETYDLLDGSQNRCGVYRIRGYLNEEMFFESCLDEFSFAETRYMNSFMDYQAYITGRKTLLKLFIEPNNQASVYRYARNRGTLEPKEGQLVTIRIEVDDVSGNQSVATFSAQMNPSAFNRDPDFLPVYQSYFNYQESNTFAGEGLIITIPAGALYQSIYFDHTRSEPGPGCYSAIYRIHQSYVPVHLPFRISIEAMGIPDHLRSKATIAQTSGNGRYTSLGGTWEGNRLVSRSRNFGTFCIRLDTIGPTIKPLNFSTSQDLATLKTFKFSVLDDFSGIRTIRGEIDGKWILLDYDPKNNLIEYVYDPDKIASGVKHRLFLRITDQLGNSSTYSREFTR